jgi:RimJ/RimL family protein N-acetyltransferase
MKRCELDTARLRLRPFQPDDLDALARLYADAEVMKYIGNGQPRTRAETEALLTLMIRQWEQHGFGRWAMILKATGELIGRCGLSFLHQAEEVELGYLLATAYWGQGLATEASRACVQFGFEQLKLERIVAVARPENLASARVMEKIGMVYQGNAFYYNAEVVYHAISRAAYEGAKTPRALPG